VIDSVNKCLPAMWREEADEIERLGARTIAKHPDASKAARDAIEELCCEKADTLRLCASQLERGLALDEERVAQALAAIAVGGVS